MKSFDCGGPFGLLGPAFMPSGSPPIEKLVAHEHFDVCAASNCTRTRSETFFKNLKRKVLTAVAVLLGLAFMRELEETIAHDQFYLRVR